MKSSAKKRVNDEYEGTYIYFIIIKRTLSTKNGKFEYMKVFQMSKYAMKKITYSLIGLYILLRVKKKNKKLSFPKKKKGKTMKCHIKI